MTAAKKKGKALEQEFVAKLMEARGQLSIDDSQALVLRIARIQLDQNKADDALATLAAAQPGAFAARFAEVRGDALLAKGDRAAALKAYREAVGSGADGSNELLTLKINALTHS